jgi:hypothetical protein
MKLGDRQVGYRGSASLGASFGFAFLAAVLCELCGKEELNREERQGFAKDAKQVLRARGKLGHYLPSARLTATHVDSRVWLFRLLAGNLKTTSIC